MIYDIVLIDNNVIDIDNNTYIKNNEWYIFPFIRNNKNITKMRLMSSNTKFLAVAFYDDHIAAITKNNFYCYDIDNCKLEIYGQEDNINVVFSGRFLIQKLDNSLIEYDPKSHIFKKLEIKEIIKSIYPGSIKLLNNDIKVVSKSDSIELSFYDINNHNLISSIYNYGIPFLLINDNVYSTRNLIFNIGDKNLILLQKNVKNICGTSTIYFMM